MTDREKAIMSAGFSPANHPAWMTVEELVERRNSVRMQHQKSLLQYIAEPRQHVVFGINN